MSVRVGPPRRGAVNVLELRSVRGTGGGPEKTILLGTARTNPERFGITVCYLRDERDRVFKVGDRAEALGINYVEVFERHSLDWRIWPQLRRLVQERRIRIVHAHDYKTDLLALLLGSAEPIIPLSTAHGWAGHSFKEQRFYYPADRLLLARFPRVIAVSSDIRDALVLAGADRERVAVIPNGIDHERYRRDPAQRAVSRHSLGLGASDVAIGAVGRLEAEKNYPLLLRAVSLLASEFPHLQLLIAGDGSQRAGLQTLADSLGPGVRCRLLGHVDDVVSLHHALDLFVMCSDNEGSPNAVLEAMAMETPVVATEVGGVPDIAQPGTEILLVPRRDSAALATAIRESLIDPARTRVRARAARLKVERDLSFERRMERLEHVYDTLTSTYGAADNAGRWWRVRPPGRTE